MSGFFQSGLQLLSNVTNSVRQATAPKSPYEVQESTIQVVAKWQCRIAESFMRLYSDGNLFIGTLHATQSPNKVFCLFKVQTEQEGMTLFTNLCPKLHPLAEAVPSVQTRDKLQIACDSLRDHPTWNCAHLAARIGLSEAFRHNVISQYLNCVDEAQQVSPIQVAVESGNMETIQELLICGVKLTMADSQGSNVFHYAARASDSTVIKYLTSRDKTAINQLNLYGESALHEACLCGKPQNVEQLLWAGADPYLTMSARYPIHCAVEADSIECVKVLCHWAKDLALKPDTKDGNLPLHYAKNKKMIFTLSEMGARVDTTNKYGETALQMSAQSNRQDCVMALLCNGAVADSRGSKGNTAIHLAVMTDNTELVQLLIVFGADVNSLNDSNLSPRHLAASTVGPNREQILYLLHSVGSLRCARGRVGCGPGCAGDGAFDGVPQRKIVTTPQHQKAFYDDVVTQVAMAAAIKRSNSATGSSIMGGDLLDSPMGASGDRVLCLDGGGIRGLILIQLLLALERVVGQPIRNCFDWIGGTSTGGILALCIVHGKTMHEAQGLYFQLKDEVFSGTRPYKSEPFENFLKKAFGESTRMTEKEYPRVLVTGVLGDRNPCELHLFRNYDIPGIDYAQAAANAKPYDPTPRPNEQLVWRAARSSGAAPTYFRAFGRFLDGGLVANNPTEDVLTEVNQYNMALRATNKEDHVRDIHVVVSLGTGRQPSHPVNAVDVYRPEGLFDYYKVAVGAKNLGSMLVEQCTQSEGRPVERARAWCSMIQVPYFRFSPQLSEEVPLDCREDRMLVNMLWETQCYIHENMEKIIQLASLLQP